VGSEGGGGQTDPDLFWAIGGNRVWGSAKVVCACGGPSSPGDEFFMSFTLRLTDQQLGYDGNEGHETYLCHRIGYFRDFIACGKRERKYNWIRGDFSKKYKDPCAQGLDVFGSGWRV
jgi:hypothetical protein